MTPPLHSAIYEGTIRHTRHTGARHAFAYPVFMMYLDLAELDGVFATRWLWSAGSRPALAWFRRADHLGDAAVALDTSVRDLVQAQTGARPAGPIRLLTHLRYAGYAFNPVNFYYCFDPLTSRVSTIVADVSNTPWGERHQYVLPADTAVEAEGTGALRYRLDKAFHVSPFMPMDVSYDWRFGTPGEMLTVTMVNRREGAVMFDAVLALHRRPLEGRQLARVLWRYPAMTMQVIAGIYWQALRLWMKGCQFYPHPRPKQKETVA